MEVCKTQVTFRLEEERMERLLRAVRGTSSAWQELGLGLNPKP